MASSKGMREPSFVKSLFFGVIDESLIFPWPAPDAQVGVQEVARVRGLLTTETLGFDLRRVDLNAGSATYEGSTVTASMATIIPGSGHTYSADASADNADVHLASRIKRSDESMTASARLRFHFR